MSGLMSFITAVLFKLLSYSNSLLRQHALTIPSVFIMSLQVLFNTLKYLTGLCIIRSIFWIKRATRVEFRSFEHYCSGDLIEKRDPVASGCAMFCPFDVPGSNSDRGFEFQICPEILTQCPLGFCKMVNASRRCSNTTLTHHEIT